MHRRTKMKLVWAAWLLVPVLIAFGIFETCALVNDLPTLSRTVYDAHQALPLIGPVWGMLVGGLTVHFFAPWDPAAYERIRELEAENAALRQALYCA